MVGGVGAVADYGVVTDQVLSEVPCGSGVFSSGVEEQNISLGDVASVYYCVEKEAYESGGQYVTKTYFTDGSCVGSEERSSFVFNFEGSGKKIALCQVQGAVWGGERGVVNATLAVGSCPSGMEAQHIFSLGDNEYVSCSRSLEFVGDERPADAVEDETPVEDSDGAREEVVDDPVEVSGEETPDAVDDSPDKGDEGLDIDLMELLPTLLLVGFGAMMLLGGGLGGLGGMKMILPMLMQFMGGGGGGGLGGLLGGLFGGK